MTEHPAQARLLLASSNTGKLREYCAMAGDTGSAFGLELLPNFDAIPPFDESAATFAENAAGKALHYSRLANLPNNVLVFADDSGLAVTALGGRPGVHSARYAGPTASNAERNTQLTSELRESGATDRSAHFICVIAVAIQGQILAVVSASIAGKILDTPRGDGGFGYDPIFFFPGLSKTFAELSPEEKNLHSHRGNAFRKLLRFLNSTAVL